MNGSTSNVSFRFAAHNGNGEIQTLTRASGFTLGDLAAENSVQIGSTVTAMVTPQGSYTPIKQSDYNTQIRDGDMINFVAKGISGAAKVVIEIADSTPGLNPKQRMTAVYASLTGALAQKINAEGGLDESTALSVRDQNTGFSNTTLRVVGDEPADA